MDKGSVNDTTSIYLLSVETGKKTRLTFPPKESLWDMSPSFFSRRSNVVLHPRQFPRGGVQIYFVSVTGGEPRLLNFDIKPGLAASAWSADGRELLISSYSSFSGFPLLAVSLRTWA